MKHLERWLFLLAGLAQALPCASAQRPVLRVCADPNNLPLSDRDGRGLENELAALVARDLGWPISYTWWAQRRGAIRNTLKAGQCDVVMGVPSSLGMVATTEPYYTSSYAFVSRSEDALDITSFDDARLRKLRIGVQIVGDDYVNTPPVHALSARGIVDNVRGFSVLGDYGEEVPAGAILSALQNREVDVALVWGPLAGYGSRKLGSRLRVTLTPAADGSLPMRFSISMGVRKQDRALLQRLNDFIVRRRPAIEQLLDRHEVPRP